MDGVFNTPARPILAIKTFAPSIAFCPNLCSNSLVAYFHISRKWTKDTVKITVKRAPKIRGDAEPNTPRICVSPSIEQCIAALNGLEYIDGAKWRKNRRKLCVYPVYKLVDTDYLHDAIGVFDASVTGEEWVKSYAVFKRIGYIRCSTLPPLNGNPDLDQLETFIAYCRISRQVWFIGV